MPERTGIMSPFQKTLFIISLLILISIYSISLLNAGSWLVKNDPPLHADAMEILMGSIPDRVLQAADVYKSGKSGKLIIVKENMLGLKVLEERGVHFESTTEQTREAAITLGIPSDSITILPGDTRSTMDEATVMKKYLSKNRSIDTLLLVTSSTHTRRASMIFKTAFIRSGIHATVLCSPSKYDGFDAKGWFKTKEGIQTVLSEYIKIADFLVFDIRHLKEGK